MPEGLITLRSVEAEGKAAAEFKSTPRYTFPILFMSVMASGSAKMKKSVPKRFSILVLVLIASVILSSNVFAQWHMDSGSVTVDLNIESSLDIMRKPGYSLEYVTANVSFIPKDNDDQSVLSIAADPVPVKSDGEYVFRWDSPVPETPTFKIDARVKTTNNFHDIRQISFPYIGFTEDIERFTMPAETIDSDHPSVVEKASELAAGETDYYAVVFKMADWTKENVKYDLSTLNIKASNKASWVLARKDGVCDEITTLFIALLRSVGIPARFVSGIAYTESPNFPENWGAHGWAEVYFPGTGWVPFDVTYGQYGFADPTHIVLKTSFDASESDTRYEWLGRQVDMVANPITVSADLVEHKGSVPDNLDISLAILQERVGIGSYNLVEATVKNKRDSYVSSFLFIAKVDELEVEGNNYQAIMLKPLETKKFYWIVKVVESLDSGYTYTFPMTVADIRNTSSDSLFYVIPGQTVFSKEEMERVVDAAMAEEKKIYSKKIDVDCAQENLYYYVYDDPKITCSARNTGNFPFKDLEFCFEDECRTADLGISQEKAFDYIVHSPKPGINKIRFTIEGEEVSKSVFYDLNVFDEPKISIEDLEYPPKIEFKQPYVASFMLNRVSSSVPQDVVLVFDAAGISKELEESDLEIDKKYLFNMDSKDLSAKPNTFKISVTFKDLNGNSYTEEEEFQIELINVTFGQRMVIFLYDMDRWLRNLFK